MINESKYKYGDLYSTAGITVYVLKALGIDISKFKASRDFASEKRYVSRFLEKNNIKPEKTVSDTFYYPLDAAYLILKDEKTIKKFKERNEAYIEKYNNLEALTKQAEKNKRINESLTSECKKVGLKETDTALIHVNRMNGGDLLFIDELAFLGKKGFVHKSDLTDEEKAELDSYNRVIENMHREEEQIKKAFKEKRLEIMITALFEKYCPEFAIDDELLLKDISTAVRSGEFDSDLSQFMNNTLEIEKIGNGTNVDIIRARLNNKDFAHNYLKEIKSK